MMNGSIIFTQDKTDFKGLLGDKAYSQIAVLIDTNTHTHCYMKVKDSIPSHEILQVSPGEEHKNLDTCKLIWEKAH